MIRTCILAHIFGTLFLWGVSPAVAQVEVSPVSPEPIPPDVPADVSGGTHGVVVYNNHVPPKLFLRVGAGVQTGDDLHLTRGGNLMSFDFQYIDTGLCGLTVDATVRFYENDPVNTLSPSTKAPLTGAPLIATVTVTGLPTYIFYTQTVDLTTPFLIPQDVWMSVEFSNSCAGLVLGDTSPSVGISDDLFWLGSPTDQVLTFTGFPLANFNLLVRAECTTDLECDDGLFCNGTETCSVLRDYNLLLHECLVRSIPCAGKTCDETLDVCVVLTGPGSATAVGPSATSADDHRPALPAQSQGRRP